MARWVVFEFAFWHVSVSKGFNLYALNGRFTKLPVILKGIITHEDARLAAKTGCKGIIVSNHGARQLDTGGCGCVAFIWLLDSPSLRFYWHKMFYYEYIVPATIEALPEIVEAVGNQLTVMIDGGIRNGMCKNDYSGDFFQWFFFFFCFLLNI